MSVKTANIKETQLIIRLAWDNACLGCMKIPGSIPSNAEGVEHCTSVILVLRWLRGI